MNLKHYKLSDINPAKYNPRKITDKELSGLTESIKKFGFIDPVIMNIRGGKNILVGGHQRLRVAEILKIKEIPVVEVDLSISEEKALNVALNSPTLSGKYDEEILSGLLDEIKIDLPELFDDLNFGDFDIPVEQCEGHTDQDAVPEVQPDPITKRGDVWLLGKHRLMCGDSTMIDDVMKLMNGEMADMIHTDPPYNIAYEGGSKKREKIANDELEDFNGFLADIYTNYFAVSKPGAAIYVWHASSETHNFIIEFINAGFLFKSYIVWNKNNSTFGRSDYHWKHEPCLYGWNGSGSHKWHGDRKQTTVWDIDRPSKSEAHPTMKPIDLCVKPIENSSKADALVIDFFLGSGSTLIACEKLKRRCYGLELSERYCDVIIKRWQDYTEKEAILESTGEAYNGHR